MLTLLAGHLLAAVAAPSLVHRFGPRAVAVLALVPAAALGWLALAPATAEHTVRWVPSLQLELALRLDPLAAALVLLVGGVGALVLLYCARYFPAAGFELPRVTALLLGFAGAMLGLVLADDLLLLYVFWELTTVLSYLLVGGTGAGQQERRAAMTALVVTTAGGLAMLVGVLLLGAAAGTFRISGILADPPPAGPQVAAALVLLLVGAGTKSALVPWHFWLPAAMAAPSPVSAYLHAAAMVKAGVYLVARLAPVFGDHGPWRPLVITFGAATMLLGGWRALRQHDLKLLLAFGTVSQLGLLVVLVGTGNRAAAQAGVALLIAHGLFKAALFLVVGAVETATGERDLRALSGLSRGCRPLFVVAGLAAASMAGVPPLLGFVAKEAALTAVAAEPLLLTVVVAGSALTVAYSARFVWGAFAGKPGVAPTPVTRPHLALVGVPGLLAVAGLALGPAAPALGYLADGYASAYPAAGSPGGGLALWHGPTPALLASLLAMAGGGALFVQRGRVEAVQHTVARVGELGDAERVYRRAMHGLDLLAVRVTAVTQRGSLAQYLAAVLLVFLLGPGSVLVLGVPWPSAWRAWDAPAQPVAAVLCITGAVGAVLARRRMSSVLLVGASGYGIALLFLIHGAPDLALTQLLVETVTLLTAALVLRRLPARVPLRTDRAVPGARSRVVLAAGVGLLMASLAAVSAGARVATPVSAGFAEAAVELGGGRNVVNVTLVDLRAWDTFGEISVLVAAATGVASLVFLRHRTGSAPRPVRPPRPRRRPGVWLPGLGALGQRQRSLLLEIGVRMIFHTVLVLSVYLLFAGHNQPGGGFVAGLVAGPALVPRYLAGGRHELRLAAPIDAGPLIGTGLLAAAGTGAAALLLGGDVLQSAILDLHVWPLGQVKLVTSLFFDIGVYLVVLGLVLDILRSLGAGVDRQAAVPVGEPAEEPAWETAEELR
jgi:multicomponent Na+:H+ antiporter subunit A